MRISLFVSALMHAQGNSIILASTAVLPKWQCISPVSEDMTKDFYKQGTPSAAFSTTADTTAALNCPVSTST
jgi:hypothetical protein